ncbi:hypothetical protein MATR_25020 [Marivirga tractuosa]|uniref:Lipoprotein n=1 Tax=Marivirga tractuosa (strain ATCC 23168 / DSM 4126 / NBRC 15989 / NCIMB 1408 / VKM B-1430 / H-43) TaxID=643867 RepID=E4TPV5_MARTH|nr:hypothetical protein [Marivirga tractuosa]ADR23642.1 hypothetical protein Ftrac_3673 [Marivirga tractuosa DSM 4126]BDD15677.1 hypothetical protein MATR_25020 [Marivirga tractuosa]
MTNTITKLFTIASIFILSGCAASYKPIYPVSLNYDSHQSQGGVELSYKYDVLRENGNKKYAKKENKKGVKLVAVKITNNSQSVVNIGKNLTLYSGNNQIRPMEPMVVKESIKQNVPGYLPYLLLSFVNLTTTKQQNGTIEYNVIPIGLVLGPGITLGNMLIAADANTKLLDELRLYNVIGRDIKPGETVHGIIGVRDIGYSPITVEFTE